MEISADGQTNTAMGLTEVQGTLWDLFGQNKDIKCTYSSTTDDETFMEGETYISGNRMRSNSVITAGRESIGGYTISDGTYMYMWSNLMDTGSKVKIETFKNTATAGNATETENQVASEQYNTSMNYKCEDWNVDESLFELPEGINFVDTSAMMESLTPTGDGNPACAACNYIQDTAQKQQCLDALDC